MPQRVVKDQFLANFFFYHPYLDIDPKSKQDINNVCQIRFNGSTLNQNKI